MTKTGDISPEVITDAKTDPPTAAPNKNSGMVWHFGGPAKGGAATSISAAP